jgi:hypothetical protein
MLVDLRDCVAKAKTMKSGHLAAAVREAFASVDPADLTQESFSGMLSMAGIQGYKVPERMAEINEILNALPAGLREKLLTEFMNELLQYREGEAPTA